MPTSPNAPPAAQPGTLGAAHDAEPRTLRALIPVSRPGIEALMRQVQGQAPHLSERVAAEQAKHAWEARHKAGGRP